MKNSNHVQNLTKNPLYPPFCLQSISACSTFLISLPSKDMQSYFPTNINFLKTRKTGTSSISTINTKISRLDQECSHGLNSSGVGLIPELSTIKFTLLDSYKICGGREFVPFEIINIPGLYPCGYLSSTPISTLSNIFVV
jgi:hypothetical protein